MSKVKINIDRPRVSAEEIIARKDFGQLLKKAKPTFMKRYGKFGLSALIIGASISLVLLFHFTTKNVNNNAQLTPKNQKEKIEIPVVNPPLKSMDVPYQVFQINASKDTLLTNSSGTTIKIPANTFTSDNSEPVEIRYREFKTPLEMVFSGIPMTYDSCGKTYQFESGGMFELLAYKKGKPLAIQPGKVAEVKMVSTSKSHDYNFYKLDESKKNWTYLGKDEQPKTKSRDFVYNAGDVKNAKDEFAKVEEQCKKLEQEKPEKPEAPNKSLYRFNIDFLPKEFPELAAYKNLQFEITGSDRPYDREIYQTEWAKVTLNASKKCQYKYTMTLKNSKEERSFSVKPVFEGKDLDSAMRIYDNAFKTYETTLIDLNTRKNNLQLKYDEFKKHTVHQAKKYVDEVQLAYNIANAKKNLILEYVKVYLVRSTGIFNCDKPLELPKGQTIGVAFANASGEKLHIKHAFLLSNDRNSCYNISGKKSIEFNPNKKNMIVVIDEDNRIGYISKKVFQNIERKEDYRVFTIEFLHNDVSKPEEVASIVHF